jgi:putative ABC transport system permease protein
MQVLRHVLRRLVRAPGFTIIALVTLALGIGANTAIFSIVNGVLIKPLPYPDPDALVGVWHVAPGIPGPGLFNGRVNCSPTMYFTYREENQTFQDFGIWSGGGASITGVAEPEQVRALFVTFGTLNAVGVHPALGRWFSEDDTQPGAARTMLLTYGYWQRRFGGDAAVIGRTVTVDSRPHTVIGVMPRDFRFLNLPAEVVLPHQFDRNRVFLGNFSFQGLARLKPGVTRERADADVARMLSIWIGAWPAPPGLDRTLFENARFGPKLTPLKEDVVGDVGNVLWVLMGTIGLVLLIACANVANLLLVRAEGRHQELAIRAALGAGWGRIARDMLIESVTLGLIGGALGLGLAHSAVKALVALGPATVPRLGEIGVDPTVLIFTLVVSLLAGLLFGIVPVMKYAGPGVIATLRAGDRTSSASRERLRARNVLVVTQVALALVLLVGSSLMIRTFQALRSVQPGFVQPANLQLLRIAIPESLVQDPERVARMQHDIVERLAAIPGTTAVAFANSAPMEGFNSNDVLFAEDKTYMAGEIPPIRRFRFIAPGYLQAVGTPMIAGRDFNWTDLYEKRRVTIVSENMAKELWGGVPAALGKRIRQGMNDPWREVVGVVGNVYDNGVHQQPPTMVYWPVLMDSFWANETFVTRSVAFAIRTERAATESFLAEARSAVWSVNPSLPVFLVRTLGDLYDQSMQRTSFTLIMLAIAGGMALVLGVVGIYGVISYAVSQRTREIGIRMALGAENGDLARMFVRHGLLLAGIGVVIGLAAAMASARLMTSLLFGIGPLDPMTYVAVPAVLVLAAVTASYMPARRVTAVDPVQALRAE